MKILEIVHLRMVGDRLETLVQDIRQACIGWGDRAQVGIYRHRRLGSDLVIHLHRNEPDGEPEPSDLGTHLASVLRIYGIVDHSVWSEAD